MLGALLWSGIAYGLNVESAWIAILIGVMVGFGARLGTREPECSQAAGVLAALIAIVALVGGKWLSTNWAISAVMSDEQMAMASIAQVVMEERGQTMPYVPDDADSFADIFPKSIWGEATRRWEALPGAEQDDICLERMDNNESLNWPPGSSFDEAWFKSDYPQDLWSEAVARWDGMSSSDQESYRMQVRETVLYEDSGAGDALRAEMQQEGFLATFGLFDAVFFIVALGAAFKIGSGA